MLKPIKRIVQNSLGRLGYRIQKLPGHGGFDLETPLPPDASDELRPDHPRLRELELRYQTFDSPVCRHTQWKAAMRNTAHDIQYFRGDNMYVWAYRSAGDSRRRFYIYGQYVRSLDDFELMGQKLVEDGAFGCFTYRYETLPLLSRDLLDSINELYFLERHCRLFSRKGLRVLDIGAGYGRLAHRMLTAADNVDRYWCIDAIPRSTFLSEYYLRCRGLAGKPDSRAVVVPLDEMERLPVGEIDLAVNVHSFSEMCYDAIEEWVRLLVRLEVPQLFLLPNQPKLLSYEADKTRREFIDILDRAGYRRVAHEPTLRDTDARELFGVNDFFWLFERK